MEEKLKLFSSIINIDNIGFTDIEVNEDLKSRYKNEDIPFMKNDFSKKFNLRNIQSDAKSVIVIIMKYENSKEKIEQLDNDIAYFSSSSWGYDYHKVLNEKLDEIIKFIKCEYGEFNYTKQVDTGDIDDRYFAYKAGLGYYGKNHLLINDELGSNFFIGSLITNIDFKKDTKLNKTCMNCNICVELCPTNALGSETLDINKCLSYITQKKEINNEEASKLNNCIYGCDICINCCPHNNTNNKSVYFKPSEIEFINLNEYESLSNKEFKEKYGHLSGSWRGKKIIERNITIIKNRKL